MTTSWTRSRSCPSVSTRESTGRRKPVIPAGSSGPVGPAADPPAYAWTRASLLDEVSSETVKPDFVGSVCMHPTLCLFGISGAVAALEDKTQGNLDPRGKYTPVFSISVQCVGRCDT